MHYSVPLGKGRSLFVNFQEDGAFVPHFFALDGSGSMTRSHPLLQRVGEAARDAGAKLVVFSDTSAFFDPEAPKIDWNQLGRAWGGGTGFKSVFKTLETHSTAEDKIVFMTDGVPTDRFEPRDALPLLRKLQASTGQLTCVYTLTGGEVNVELLRSISHPKIAPKKFEERDLDTFLRDMFGNTIGVVNDELGVRAGNYTVTGAADQLIDYVHLDRVQSAPEALAVSTALIAYMKARFAAENLSTLPSTICTLLGRFNHVSHGAARLIALVRALGAKLGSEKAAAVDGAGAILQAVGIVVGRPNIVPDAELEILLSAAKVASANNPTKYQRGALKAQAKDAARSGDTMHLIKRTLNQVAPQIVGKDLSGIVVMVNPIALDQLERFRADPDSADCLVAQAVIKNPTCLDCYIGPTLVRQLVTPMDSGFHLVTRFPGHTPQDLVHLLNLTVFHMAGKRLTHMAPFCLLNAFFNPASSDENLKDVLQLLKYHTATLQDSPFDTASLHVLGASIPPSQIPLGSKGMLLYSQFTNAKSGHLEAMCQSLMGTIHEVNDPKSYLPVTKTLLQMRQEVGPITVQEALKFLADPRKPLPDLFKHVRKVWFLSSNPESIFAEVRALIQAYQCVDVPGFARPVATWEDIVHVCKILSMENLEAGIVRAAERLAVVSLLTGPKRATHNEINACICTSQLGADLSIMSPCAFTELCKAALINWVGSDLEKLGPDVRFPIQKRLGIPRNMFVPLEGCKSAGPLLGIAETPDELLHIIKELSGQLIPEDVTSFHIATACLNMAKQLRWQVLEACIPFVPERVDEIFLILPPEQVEKHLKVLTTPPTALPVHVKIDVQTASHRLLANCFCLPEVQDFVIYAQRDLLASERPTPDQIYLAGIADSVLQETIRKMYTQKPANQRSQEIARCWMVHMIKQRGNGNVLPTSDDILDFVTRRSSRSLRHHRSLDVDDLDDFIEGRKNLSERSASPTYRKFDHDVAVQLLANATLSPETGKVVIPTTYTC